jgi:D-glycero-D-manno-heptose 1,7-bisphosphate phosphatase
MTDSELNSFLEEIKSHLHIPITEKKKEKISKVVHQRDYESPSEKILNGAAFSELIGKEFEPGVFTNLAKEYPEHLDWYVPILIKAIKAACANIISFESHEMKLDYYKNTCDLKVSGVYQETNFHFFIHLDFQTQTSFQSFTAFILDNFNEALASLEIAYRLILFPSMWSYVYYVAALLPIKSLAFVMEKVEWVNCNFYLNSLSPEKETDVSAAIVPQLKELLSEKKHLKYAGDHLLEFTEEYKNDLMKILRDLQNFDTQKNIKSVGIKKGSYTDPYIVIQIETDTVHEYKIERHDLCELGCYFNLSLLPLQLSKKYYLFRNDDYLGYIFGTAEDAADFIKFGYTMKNPFPNWKIDKSWTLFLDRDGVINTRFPGDYVKCVDEFEFLPGAKDAIAKFSNVFGKIIVVTNQQGIARGIYSHADLNSIHEHMKSELEKSGGKIEAVYYAPQSSAENSPMRKPGIGMALQAKKDFPEIDFSKAIIVGDSQSDMEFGKTAGMKTIFVGEEALNIPVDGKFSSLREFAANL